MSVYNGADDLAYTLVVNEAGLMLTPMGKMMMPPPMCEKEIKIDSVPTSVSMFNHDVAAISSQGQLFFFDASTVKNPTSSLSVGFQKATYIQNFVYKN